MVAPPSRRNERTHTSTKKKQARKTRRCCDGTGRMSSPRTPSQARASGKHRSRAWGEMTGVSLDSQHCTDSQHSTIAPPVSLMLLPHIDRPRLTHHGRDGRTLVLAFTAFDRSRSLKVPGDKYSSTASIPEIKGLGSIGQRPHSHSCIADIAVPSTFPHRNASALLRIANAKEALAISFSSAQSEINIDSMRRRLQRGRLVVARLHARNYVLVAIGLHLARNTAEVLRLAARVIAVLGLGEAGKVAAF